MARLVAGIAFAVLAVLVLPGAAGAAVFCDYVDAGPDGPSGNVLAVTSIGEFEEPEDVDEGEGEENEISAGTRIATRRDGTIAVIAPGREPVECAGGQPTLTNIDTLRVVSSSETFVLVDLQNGRLAPGATDEGDGSSEIESSFSAEYGAMFVRGGPGPDRFAAAGVGAEGRLGANLNPRADGDHADRDLIVDPENVLGLLGGGGADRIIATLEQPAHERVEAYLYMVGGPGDDVLVGNTGFGVMLGGEGSDVMRAGVAGARLEGGPGDDELFAGPGGSNLSGGDGDDLLFGGLGRDSLTGDGGNDRLRARAGDDSIRARDGDRDGIDCGPGHDRLRSADDGDRKRRCERRGRREHRPPLPLPPIPPPQRPFG